MSGERQAYQRAYYEAHKEERLEYQRAYRKAHPKEKKPPRQRERRVCSVEECEKIHFARGWCKMHYGRWWRENNPPTRTCEIEGCAKPRTHRDWCSAHYRRWSVYGDPLGGGPNQRPPGTCEVEGCEDPSRGRGLCRKHLQYWHRYGDAEAVPKRCVSQPLKEGEDRPRCSNHNEPMVPHRSERSWWACAVKKREQVQRYYDNMPWSKRFELQLKHRRREGLKRMAERHARLEEEVSCG